MMGISSIKPITVLLVAGVALAGCQSSRIGALQTQSQPAPLTPAPSGTVTSNQLPPPVQPGNQQPNGNFPTAPENEANPNGTDVASADSQSSIQNVSTNAPVTKEALVGAWKVSTGGSSCQMFMALTKWTGGFRAASRGCPGDAASVSAWNVSGNKVVLSDTNGNQVATLFQSGPTQYNGQTSGGSAISLSR
ncbi:protease inhibitor Inh/omp19 family protein [Ahrensia marina]|nr:protease inhibitor Inh/omp19 family protein [Ahrensia marina]